MRILVHASSSVYPYFDGTQLRTFHVLPFLAERHSLDLIQERWPWEETTTPISPYGYSPDWVNQYCERVTNVWHKPGERLRYGIVRECPELYRALDYALSTGGYDVVYAQNESFPLYTYDRKVSHPPALTGPTDSEHLHYWRALRLTRQPRQVGRLLARWTLYTLYQVRVLNRMAYWTMVSEKDAADMKRLSPKCRIRVIPNGVDSQWFAPPANNVRDPRMVVFVGTLGLNTPNEAAVKWFLSQVWPDVVKIEPDARFVVVGRNPSLEMTKLSQRSVGTKVVGPVTDPRPYLWRAGIFVLPMQSGAGIKNKLLEAWAAGCSVVSTPLGTEGAEYAAHKNNVLITATPQEMARTIVNLMHDTGQQKKLAEAGRQTVGEHYSWRGVATQLERYLIEIAEEARSRQI